MFNHTVLAIQELVLSANFSQVLAGGHPPPQSLPRDGWPPKRPLGRAANVPAKLLPTL